MSRFRREEDAADLWLREHDPYYTDPKKNKRKFISHPYDTPDMEHRRIQSEIPISNLNGHQKIQFSMIAGAFDEDGNFEL